MIHRGVKQGSTQWLKLRMGIPTASEFDQILTPKFAVKDSEGSRTYLYKKLAEKLTGHGQLFEEEARELFSLTTDLDIEQVGFVTADDGRCGCSPDGLIGDDSGLEIKCPNAETHLRYLDAGVVPNDYVVQVNGCLYVTGRKAWRFMSYFPELPPLIVTVERDEEKMTAIRNCLTKFYADFDAALERLTKKAA
jgi:hypothetical protein